MASKVRSIERRPIAGGIELTARGQSARGTRYIVGTAQVLREGRSKEEFSKAVVAAIDLLMAPRPSEG